MNVCLRVLVYAGMIFPSSNITNAKLAIRSMIVFQIKNTVNIKLKKSFFLRSISPLPFKKF